MGDFDILILIVFHRMAPRRDHPFFIKGDKNGGVRNRDRFWKALHQF